MASGEHLKVQLRSHIKGDDSHFLAVAVRMAAHETRLGHGKLAEDLRALIDSATLFANQLANRHPVPIGQSKIELSSLLSVAWRLSRHEGNPTTVDAQ